MTNTRDKGLDVARYSPAERLVELGLLLSEARGGLTLNEMVQRLGVGRRTIERMRDTLDRLTGGLEYTLSDDGHKRWRLPTARFDTFTLPNLEELAELKIAVSKYKAQGAIGAAQALERLSLKLEAAMPRTTMRRLEPDLDALLEASSIAARVGPRSSIDPQVIKSLRDAILSGHQVRLSYLRRDTNRISRPIVHPYGLLSGPRDYLVGFNVHPKVRDYRLYVTANIQEVERLSAPYERDPSFDLTAFSARSFGMFWDDRSFDVEWRFKPEVAEDVKRFRFHPNQVLHENADRSITVKFNASGLTEMAWHLFTWGTSVEILKPEALAERYRELLEHALKACKQSASPVSVDREGDLRPTV